MDRAFKKIQEGVENLEEIEAKMNTAEIPAQKEILAADLKTQIKKLLRQKDQLTVWWADSNVKNKDPIIEHRRLIDVVRDARLKVITRASERWLLVWLI